MARRVRGQGGRDHDFEWFNMADSLSNLDNAEGSVIVGPTGLLASTALTIFRARGKILGILDTGAVDERVIVEIGLAVVGAPAFTAGVASLPTPVTEDQYPFFWRGQLAMSSGAEAAVITDGLFDRVEIDSKAMRKMKPDEAIVLVFEVAGSSDQAGTTDYVYSIDILTGA